MVSRSMFKGPFHVGPIQFDQPQWLLLFIPALLLILWWGRQSLSGMGTNARRFAMLVRLVVVLLILAAVARPEYRRESRNVNVTVISDVSESVPKDRQKWADEFVDQAARATGEGAAQMGDEIARVTVARNAYVQALPSPPQDKPDTINVGATDGTNLAEALRLAMAVMPGGSANRLLIVSDGNETAGDLLSAASAAKAKGIPIDVLPLRYKYDNEVTVERLVAPSTARVGQNINLRVLINSQKPARGRLSLLVNGVDVDLDPSSPETSRVVDVKAGLEAIVIPITLPFAGPQQYEATFVPEEGADSIADNNRAMAVTFVSAEGRVLVVAPDEQEVGSLLRALREAKMAVEYRSPEMAPKNAVEIASYDAIVLANCEARPFSQEQQEILKSYVYDLGGGLVMVGGPEAFGAGGWTGSPLADALPIKLDPPAKRQLPRGALVLVMHSCEMPQGNYWGKKTAEAAVNNLSRLDLAGILEAGGFSGDTWTHPLSEIGNRAAINRAIASLNYGDAPSFDGMLTMAYTALVGVEAGARHILVISDGDPSFTNPGGLMSKMRAAKISISTVLVFPHNRQGGFEWDNMKRLARDSGGRFYSVIDQGNLASLPSIFIKESTVVKRSLRWEGPAFSPTMTNVLSEPLRGINGLPPITGYIVGADREGLSVVSARGKENDPILAHWQFGLGKSVAFTSDAGAAYAKGWPSWDHYRQFWEQHVRWAMRPAGTSDIRIATEDLGDQTRIVVDALDQQGERMNFVRFRARVLGPENAGETVELRQVGPGRYEGIFDSGRAGAYIANIQYQTPGAEGQPPRQGNVQTAVTRPFAKEFKTLQDNAGLLRLVAEKTGGRVLTGDPAGAALWSRQGLTMPVALRPIWMAVALLAIGLFLADVAVRRVRIEPRAIAAAVRRAFNPAQSRGSERTASLKEIRKRAQDEIRGRTDLSPEQKAAALAQVKSAAKGDQSTSKVKFEATAEELARSKKNVAMAGDTTPDAGKIRVKSREVEKQGPTKEEGIARLRKAKERAREELEEE